MDFMNDKINWMNKAIFHGKVQYVLSEFSKFVEVLQSVPLLLFTDTKAFQNYRIAHTSKA